MRFLLVLAALTAGCVPGARLPIPNQETLPQAAGPEVIVRFSLAGPRARRLLEEVAARCWLDGITRGAQLIVDRQTGAVIIVGDTDDLLSANFLAPRGGRSRIRLSGPVVGNQRKADALVRTLDRAVKTGETFCPIGTA